ncbi:LAQU0S26e00782g1_1 [Lachancea quebecensis]|uniref:LAQU0S26e00782g1_1 n=1 Tax=Lachancea quebecensis TaxID=1654605 RepID=A0A0P1KZX7_9SACH|nr:LAQU0S26e00782g1_1 [Lachancea quebecensis]
MAALHSASEMLLTFQSSFSNETQVDFGQLQALADTRITQGILFGTRIGTSILTIITLYMVSKNRRTPIFISNFVSLFFVGLHSALYLGYLTTPFASLTFNMTLFPDLIPRSNLHLFAATNVIQVLLVAAVEASLILQVRIIFHSNTLKPVGRTLVALSTVLATATTVLFLVSAVKSIKSVYADVLAVQETLYFNLATIMLATSVNFMTLLLTVKLVLAIRSRRFLGLKQFDSFHILLIMSFQTMIFPSLLLILSYALNGKKGTDTLSTLATLLVTLSLPLSSMWATSANNSLRPSSVNTRFSPCLSDSGGSKFDNHSLFSHSMNSTTYQRNEERAYDLYPISRSGNTNEDYGYGMESLDKDNCRTLAVSIKSGDTSPGSSSNGELSRLPTSDSRQHTLDALERTIQAGAFTPNTVDDEAARSFWANAKP